jgi:hypothetical protein
MRTVLSLVIRGFLALLGACFALASPPTRAGELQFDLTGTAYTGAASRLALCSRT